MEQRVVQIAEALVRSGTEVLLVRQQKDTDPEPYWTLPGGLLEPGELPTEAAFRETLEETGIAIHDPDRLAYLSAHESPSRAGQLLVFCFETQDWSGGIVCEDPDKVVSDARFFPVPEAIHALESIAWSEMRGWRMRAPLVAYLRGETPPGAVWLYREQLDGTDALVACVSGEGRRLHEGRTERRRKPPV